MQGNALSEKVIIKVFRISFGNKSVHDISVMKKAKIRRVMFNVLVSEGVLIYQMATPTMAIM